MCLKGRERQSRDGWELYVFNFMAEMSVWTNTVFIRRRIKEHRDGSVCKVFMETIRLSLTLENMVIKMLFWIQRKS